MESTTKENHPNASALGGTSGEGVHPPPHSNANGSMQQSEEERNMPVKIDGMQEEHTSWIDMRDEDYELTQKFTKEENGQMEAEPGESNTRVNTKDDHHDFFEGNTQLSDLESHVSASLTQITSTLEETQSQDLDTLNARSQTEDRQSTENTNIQQQRKKEIEETQGNDENNPQPTQRKSTMKQENKRGNRHKSNLASAKIYNQLFGENSWPRYLRVKMSKKISKLDFENYLLKQCATKEMNFKKISEDNEWLIEATSERQSMIYQNLKNCDGAEIEVIRHETLNSCYGTIILPPNDENIDYIREKEKILENLKLRHPSVQDVEVYAIPSRKNRQNQITIAKVKFDGSTLPFRIRLMGESLEVREFIPKPLQCLKCFRFGHSKKYCKREPKCGYCGSEEHENLWNCGDAPKCANCGQEHHARHKECIHYVYNTQLKLLQTRRGMSIKEARIELRSRNYIDPNHQITYSEVTRRNEAGREKSESTVITPDKVVETRNRYASLATENFVSTQELDMDADEVEDIFNSWGKGEPKRRRSRNRSRSLSPTNPMADLPRQENEQKKRDESVRRKEKERSEDNSTKRKEDVELPKRREVTEHPLKETEKKRRTVKPPTKQTYHNRDCACHECMKYEISKYKNSSIRTIGTVLNKMTYHRNYFPRYCHNPERSEPCLCVTHLKEMMRDDVMNLTEAMEKTFPEMKGVFEYEKMNEVKKKMKDSSQHDRKAAQVKGDQRGPIQ